MRSHHKCLSKAVWGLSVDFSVYLPTFACLFCLCFGISYIFATHVREQAQTCSILLCVCVRVEQVEVEQTLVIV